MNNKGLILVSVILMLLVITISSASAGEIDGAEDLTINEEMAIDNGDSIDLNEGLNNEDNTIIEENEEFEQSDNPREKETLSDSNSYTVEDKTFSGIQTAIDGASDGGTITLDGIYLNDGNSHMNVNKTLSFIGINNATLDACKLSGIFNISANNVDIKNINFINGNSNLTGVAINTGNSLNLSIENCSFANNNAILWSILDINTGSVVDCLFTNNIAREYTVNLKNVFINNCSFVNNSNSGGTSSALSISSGSVSNCSFVNNSALSAGAINKWGGSDVVSIENCSFVNNSGQAGGAIKNWGILNIYNCSFVNNTAKRYSDFLNGGAVYSQEKITLIDCTFRDNNGDDGGAIHISGSSSTISNCSFVNNSGQSGGAINLLTSCSISNCSFVNNSGQYGGSIQFNGSAASVADCCFVNNSAQWGGAIFSPKLSLNELSIINSIFIDNSANEFGGAIHLFNDGHISDCSFVNNSANIGGSISWAAENGIITHCNFTNNSAVDSGGAIYLNSSTNSVNISNCDFRNNSVSNNYIGVNRGGGAVCLIGNGIHIKLCSFISNLAKFSNGGALFLNTTGLANTLGTNNLLSSNALSASDKNNIIEQSTFQGNGAYNGTAIYIEDDANILFNNFFYIDDNELEKLVAGMTLDQLSNNDFTKTKLNASVNSSDISAIYGETIIGSSSSVNAKSISVIIYDKNNVVVYAKEINPNSEFVIPSLAAGTYTANFTTIVEEGLYIPSSCKSTITITPAKSNVSAAAVTSYYGKTFSVSVKSNNATSIIYTIKNSTGSVVKSGTLSPGQAITGLKFALGKYTLTLTAVVDGNHTGSSASSKITVNKATANITAKALTTYYNSGKTWSITLKDNTNNKLMSKVKLALKVYTGSKYKTYYATTNSKGVATFKASTLAAGTHKVIVSYSNKNYNCKALTSSLKINKMSLTYKVTKSTQKDGAGLHILVKNKATGKVANKIKIKLRVFTGKKYKQYTLVSAKYGNKGNGYVGFAVKGPVFSVGTHTVKILAGDNNHAGSVSSKLVLKSTVKKYGKKTIIISNGKRTVK